VDGTILLHIAAIFNNDGSPIATQGGAGAYITIFSDDDIAGNCRLWMHKGTGMYNGLYALEGIKHNANLFPEEIFYRMAKFVERPREGVKLL
jgi:hypothetical protein